MRIRFRKYLIASTLGLAAAGSLVMGIAVTTTPAQAQLTVFDPSNYSQNLLTAARTLQQVNNQIRLLQTQTQSLINQSKNLTTINFPELQAITQMLRQIDQLMGQGQAIQFRVANLDQQFRSLFPTSFNAAITANAQAAAAKTRLDTSKASFQQAMTVQAQVVENVQADATTLSGIVARSQGAEGSLQAQQATNQLLALTTKQQFQIQNLTAAQYRADATEAARRVQAEQDAHSATQKFLGTGQAYTPQ